MKKIKIAFWLIVAAVVALFIYQNKSYFITQHARFEFNIPLTETIYVMPDMANGLLFLGSLFLGFIIAYFFSLFSKFKDGKTIKNMRFQIKKERKVIEDLKKEIQNLKENHYNSGPAQADKQQYKEPESREDAAESKTG